MTAADTDENEASDRLFADATRRIASGQMEVAPLIHDATRLQAARRQAQSAELYKSWIALNADHPVLLRPPISVVVNAPSCVKLSTCNCVVVRTPRSVAVNPVI